MPGYVLSVKCCGRSAAEDAQSKEDGEEEAALEAAKRVKDEAEAALRRAQQARMEVYFTSTPS